MLTLTVENKSSIVAVGQMLMLWHRAEFYIGNDAVITEAGYAITTFGVRILISAAGHRVKRGTAVYTP